MQLFKISFHSCSHLFLSYLLLNLTFTLSTPSKWHLSWSSEFHITTQNVCIQMVFYILYLVLILPEYSVTSDEEQHFLSPDKTFQLSSGTLQSTEFPCTILVTPCPYYLMVLSLCLDDNCWKILRISLWSSPCILSISNDDLSRYQMLHIY